MTFFIVLFIYLKLLTFISHDSYLVTLASVSALMFNSIFMNQ